MNNIALGKGQAEAQSQCGYGSIRLRRVNDYAVVEVEYQGKFHEAIREHIDGAFCHIVEPIGILEILQRKGKRA